MKMHDDELDIEPELVERMLTAQFPDLADLPVTAVHSTGTVNAIYRLGDHLCARLPRRPSWVTSLSREITWLPRLRPHLSLTTPEPIATGQPTNSYPVTWAIYRWIDGQPYQDNLVHDERHAAEHLGHFVAELRRLDPDKAPRGGRAPLHRLDALSWTAIRACDDAINQDAAMSAWERALRAPEWNGIPAWIHADLLRPNLLVHDGYLQAVIDFGGVGIGDPAADVIAAWSVFTPTGRETYRDALDVDDGTWNRARGYALHQAALIIPYYTETNPTFAQLAQRTVEQVIADDQDRGSL